MFVYSHVVEYEAQQIKKGYMRFVSVVVLSSERLGEIKRLV